MCVRMSVCVCVGGARLTTPLLGAAARFQLFLLPSSAARKLYPPQRNVPCHESNYSVVTMITTSGGGVDVLRDANMKLHYTLTHFKHEERPYGVKNKYVYIWNLWSTKRLFPMWLSWCPCPTDGLISSFLLQMTPTTGHMLTCSLPRQYVGQPMKAAAFLWAEAVFSSYQRHCVPESPGARTACSSVAGRTV